MSLRSVSAVTVAGYQSRTGDTTTETADVEAALDEAEQMLAEHLRRLVDGESALASAERTARLRIHPDGRVYPPAYPVTAATGLTVENTRMLLGGTPDVSTFVGFFPTAPEQPYATVTWTGGWDDNTCPLTIRHAVYDLAHALATSVSPVPVGAKSVALGDASVTYADSAVPYAGIDTLVAGLSGRVLRYRNRLGDGLA